MSKRKVYNLVVLSFTAFFIMYSCMDDDALWERQPPDFPFSGYGVFIINEGNFMYGNASLSYYDPLGKRIFNDVFFNQNGLPLGDVAQSMTIWDNKGYIVVNNSGRIYIIDLESFELTGKITGLVSPREIHFINDEKAYITDLYARSIAIVNPQTNELTGQIQVANLESNFLQHSTDQMIQVGKYIFTNAWSFDNSVLVIDSETDQWVSTIKVPNQPQSMALDKFGGLWVLCDGGFAGSPHGQDYPALIRIDSQSHEITKEFRFAIADNPRALAINGSGDTLYFINQHVYRYVVGSGNYPEIFLESPYSEQFTGGFRGLGIDPYSSEVYVTDGIDFVQPGLVYRFSALANPIDTFKTGIIPGSITFAPLSAYR